MNYIRHLTGFYEKIQEDTRLNPTHISLYLALFQFWNLNHFQNPISISRNEMMKLSKIAAFGTYHKCIKELQEFGYIEYIPSFNPYKGSLVNLYNFDWVEVQNQNTNHAKNQTSSIQELNQHHVKTDTGYRQALEPSINYINIVNNKHIKNTPETNSNFEQEEIVTKKNNYLFSDEEKEKLRKKKMKRAQLSPISVHKIPPSFAEVKLFFDEKDAQLSEAEKFFDHYESNGWLVGGKSKMKNWEAAARNWLKNSQKFETVIVSNAKQSQFNKRNHLAATTNKSYKEPL